MWLWERPFLTRKTSSQQDAGQENLLGPIDYWEFGCWNAHPHIAYWLELKDMEQKLGNHIVYVVSVSIELTCFHLEISFIGHTTRTNAPWTLSCAGWIAVEGFFVTSIYLGKKSRLISWRCLRWMYKLSFQVVCFLVALTPGGFLTWSLNHIFVGASGQTGPQSPLRSLRTSFVERDSSWEQPALRPCFRSEHFRSQKCG